MQLLLDILQEIQREELYWINKLNSLEHPEAEYPFLIDIQQTLKDAKVKLLEKIEEKRKNEEIRLPQDTP